jgi:hypothetical protein
MTWENKQHHNTRTDVWVNSRLCFFLFLVKHPGTRRGDLEISLKWIRESRLKKEHF